MLPSKVDTKQPFIKFCTYENTAMNFTEWKNYFKANKIHFDWLKWSDAQPLLPQESNLIYRTIQTFQKGENSEGKNLIHYAKAHGDADYYEAIVDFIREEQRHALVLGKFMTLNGIPKVKEQWSDTVFRRMRNLAGLELSVTVLLTAEIIAAIFYKALHRCTSNETLKLLCHQILIDEEMHINFQSYTLSTLHSKKSGFRQWIDRKMHRVLMEGTLLVVYVDHRKVLKAGGLPFAIWRQEIIDEFRRAEMLIRTPHLNWVRSIRAVA